MFQPPRVSMAFALGGLHGFNGHGIGFLDAARELQVEPSFITCSGSMIAWVAAWLDGHRLLPLLERETARRPRLPAPFDGFSRSWLAAFGAVAPGRLAVPEYWQRWFSPLSGDHDGRAEDAAPGPSGSGPSGSGLSGPGLAKAWLDRALPAQVLVPSHTAQELERVAERLNASDTPVAFNSFQPQAGRGYLHVNPAAADFLGVRPEPVGGASKFTPITAEMVSAAMWIHEYGFDRRQNPHGLVAGLYHRQFIIAELHMMSRIYAVRPMNTRWLGQLPANWLETRDFTRRMWLNGAYGAETARMRLINQLIETGRLSDELFRRIELIEVQVEQPCEESGQAEGELALYRRAAAQAHQILREREHAPVPCGLPLPCTLGATRHALSSFMSTVPNDICYLCEYYSQAQQILEEADHERHRRSLGGTSPGAPCGTRECEPAIG